MVADVPVDVSVPSNAGERVKASVRRYLTRELMLAVNEQKRRVVKTNDCEFLGFTFRGTKQLKGVS